jgi:acetyl-CoA C-acetyltransferase
MAQAFICDAIRTPIGKLNGSLVTVRADDLAALPLKALMDRNARVDWSALDDVILGCANQAGEVNRNVARIAVLLAGMPDGVPGVTVNRLCSSGLNALGWRFVNPAMKAAYGVNTMPQTGENVAEQWQVSREEQDRFALASQEKAARVQASGRFSAEIVPVSIPQRKGDPILFDADEQAWTCWRS